MQTKFDFDSDIITSAARELSLTYSAHECEEGWDYGYGIVDVDLLSEEEVDRLMAAAEHEDERCYIEREEGVAGIHARGFTTLNAAALALAPLMLEGAEYEDDPQGLLDARRVRAWDPCDTTGPIPALCGDREYAVELQAAVRLAFALNVAGYDWTQASLRLAFRYDDYDRLDCLRHLQAALIAINDPALRRRVGDYSREYDRIFGGIEDEIDAELEVIFAQDGIDADSPDAQALRDAAEKAIREIEDSVNDFDFT